MSKASNEQCAIAGGLVFGAVVALIGRITGASFAF